MPSLSSGFFASQVDHIRSLPSGPAHRDGTNLLRTAPLEGDVIKPLACIRCPASNIFAELHRFTIVNHKVMCWSSHEKASRRRADLILGVVGGDPWRSSRCPHGDHGA